MKAKEILKEGYIAFVIDDKTRNMLKTVFPPKYSESIGHHITYKFGVRNDTPLPSNITTAEVVGYIDDGDSIEALVVSLDGETARKDGQVYHITWSLDRSKGRSPKDSKKLLKTTPWTKVKPITINVKATMLDF